MIPAIDVDELTASMEELLASGREIPAVDLRIFQAKMIAGLATLNARARGNRIFYVDGLPDDGMGLEGDLAVNKLSGDFFEFKAGTFGFLFNVVPRAVAGDYGAAFKDQDNGTTTWLLSPALARKPAQLRLVRLAVPVSVPEPVAVADTPAVPAPGPTFAPATRAVKPTAPKIAKHTRRAGAGEAVLLSVTDTPEEVEALVYSDGKLYRAAGRARDNAAVFQLPADLPPTPALFWLKSDGGESAPFLLNQTQVDWVERHITPGLVCHIYGAALEGCAIYMQSQAGGDVVECEVLTNDGFEVAYTTPDLAAGPVWLWAHNKKGGALGWSERHAADMQDNATHLLTRAWNGPGQATVTLAVDGTNNGQLMRNGLNTANSGASYGQATVNAGSFAVERSIFCPGGKSRIVGAKDGQGNPATTLYPAANFVSEGFGLFGSPFAQQDFVVENIRFINPNRVDIGGDFLVAFKQFKGVNFVNCIIENHDGGTIRFGANPDDGVSGEQVYMTNVRHTGSGASMLETNYLYVRGGGYKATMNADSMYNNTGANYYAFANLTVGDLDPDSDQLSEVGVGRVLKAGLNSGSMQCGYLGHCVGLGIGPLPNVPDPNQAEGHMIEGAFLTYQDFPISQGPRTLTFANAIPVNENTLSTLKTDGVVPGRHFVQIQSGPGRGLCFALVACDGHTMTLDRDIPVTLTNESRVAVGLFHQKITMVFNKFTGRKGITTGGFTAQTGAQVYGGGVDWTIENNDFQELYNGVVISGTHEKTASVAASMFITVRRNKIMKCGRAYLLFVVPNEPTNWSFSTTAVFAVNLSQNVVSGSVRGDLGFEAPRNAREMGLCPKPPLDYLVSDQPFAGEILNYYRAAEIGQSPKPLLAGTVSNQEVLGEAAEGLVPGPVTGVPLPLPSGAALDGNYISYVADFPHVLAYVAASTELVPLARTAVASDGGGVPLPSGYSDDEIDALLLAKANLVDGLLPVDELPELVNPLAYNFMVNNRSRWVGYDSLAAAAAANPFRSIVANCAQYLQDENLTLTGDLIGRGRFQLLLDENVVLRLGVAAVVQNANILGVGDDSAYIQLTTTQGSNVVPQPSQALQLIDSRISSPIALSVPAHGITCRGTSTVTIRDNSAAGIVYLFDQSFAGIPTNGPKVVDGRPGVPAQDVVMMVGTKRVRAQIVGTTNNYSWAYTELA
jgi:hypothetical protein